MRNFMHFSHRLVPTHTPRVALWVLLGFCFPLLLGCATTPKKTPTQNDPPISKEDIPRSPDPVVKVLSKQGRKLRYNVYNSSGQAFRGLVVIFEGVDCDGIRPRRLWAKLISDHLEVGDMRPFMHYIPRFCHHVKVIAFDRVKFARRFRKHKPFVRYKFIPDQRKVAYKIYNRSILPFRGLTVLIRGTDCSGPKTNYILETSSRAWLRPGYLRSFVRNMPYPCRSFRVFAFDRIDFKRLKQRMIRLYRKRKRLQMPPTQYKPPVSQEI